MWFEALAGDSVSRVAAAWLPALLDAAIKGTVLLGIVGLSMLLMRRATAAARHLVWFLAAASLPVLPVLSVVSPEWHVLPSWMAMPIEVGGEAAPARGKGPRAPVEAVAAGDLGNVPASPIEPAPPQPTPPRLAEGPQVTLPAVTPTATPPQPPVGRAGPAGDVRWRAWSLLGWLAGTAIVLAPCGLGMLNLWWLRRTAEWVTGGPWISRLDQCAAEIGVTRRVVLLRSNRRWMPMHWGILRPKLLLPSSADDWSEEQKRMVLLHELAHVRRWDCLTGLVARAACALYWFNPLVWMALRRMHLEQEVACDDLILRAGCQAPDYAEHLLQIASGLKASRLAAYSGIAMARRSRLEGRLLAILDSDRNRRTLTGAAVLLALLLLVGVVVPVAMMQAKDGFRASGDPLEIRLVGVRPDGGDELYDPQGKLIGRMADYDGRHEIWNDNEMPRDFIFELARTEVPVKWINPVMIRPSGRDDMLALGRVELVDRPEGPPRVWLPVKLRRTYRGRWGFRKAASSVDLTLRYYLGLRGPADCRFSGPFKVGKTTRDDAGAGYSLKTDPPEKASVDEVMLKFTLRTDRRFDFGTPLIAYDAAGRWHLADYGGGSRTSDGTELESRLRGVPLEQIVAITFNEKPREKVFHNVVVRYPNLPQRNHAAHLDIIASRLGMANPSPQKIRDYSFQSPDEAVKCIDLVHGYGVTQVWQAIRYGEPRVKPVDLEPRRLSQLRAAAKGWSASSDARVRIRGVQLGLWGCWAEFFEPALEIARSNTHPRDDAARAIFEYSDRLTPEQVQQIKQALLDRDDPVTHTALRNCLLRRPEVAGTTEALLELAESDRVWLWWRAVYTLSVRRESGWKQLQALAAEQPEMHRRVALAVGPGRLPNESEQLVDAAHAALPGLLTPALLRMDLPLCSDVMRCIEKHLDRTTATAALVGFLRRLLDEWELSNIHGRANMNYWAVDRTVRYLNNWHKLNLGGLGGDLSKETERDWEHDWKALAQEASRRFERSQGEAETETTADVEPDPKTKTPAAEQRTVPRLNR